MAGLFLDQLPLITSLTGTELALVQKAGTTGRIDVQAIANLAPVGPSLAIGSAVGGGTPNYVLFVDAGGLLAQDANFQWQPAIQQLNVTGLAPNWTLRAINSGISATFASGTIAGYFADGLHSVFICDGTNAVNYEAASPANWAAATPPTDVWVALDRIAVALTLLGTPP